MQVKHEPAHEHGDETIILNFCLIVKRGSRQMAPHTGPEQQIRLREDIGDDNGAETERGTRATASYVGGCAVGATVTGFLPQLQTLSKNSKQNIK
ncbi:hypothetical protein PABG_11912 [Paracoccidioides brasiliensis Pb03]|nr:hypothetical protein PABG_11912 [Paracoccidioides brasiliensis Pb03]